MLSRLGIAWYNVALQWFALAATYSNTSPSVRCLLDLASEYVWLLDLLSKWYWIIDSARRRVAMFPVSCVVASRYFAGRCQSPWKIVFLVGLWSSLVAELFSQESRQSSDERDTKPTALRPWRTFISRLPKFMRHARCRSDRYCRLKRCSKLWLWCVCDKTSSLFCHIFIHWRWLHTLFKFHNVWNRRS